MSNRRIGPVDVHQLEPWHPEELAAYFKTGVATRGGSRMTLGDLAFLVGPAGAVIVVPVAVAVMLTRRYQRDWTATFLLLLCPVLGAAWLGYWILWVKIFQYMDRYEPVPPLLDRSANLCLVVCAASVTALAVAMMLAVSDSRYERRTAMRAQAGRHTDRAL